MMHGSQGGGPYGFRGVHGSGAYGRSGYGNQASNWLTSGDYGGFTASQAGGSGGGPMRLSYQHRSWAPYGGKF
mgnify:CR=1 FL=1